MITINSNTRQFNVPGADLVFGVVADSDAERKHFQCPRYVGDNLDLASCFIRINYRNANGKTDFYLVDDMVIDGDNITFSWLLSPKVTEYRGQVRFVMCAVGPDFKLKWHTTQGYGQVMEGLEPDNAHVESQTADVVAQLISMVKEQTTAVENTGADQVAAVNAAAKTAQDSAVAEIEAKRFNSLNSIPADYTSMGNAVDAMEREKAPGIVCSTEGEVITLNDSSDNQLRGLRIFGKSTQDGVPTPEKPVEIVSVCDSGSVDVFVSGKNLFAGWIVGGVTEDGTDYASTIHRRTNYVPISTPGQKYIVSGIPNTLYTMAVFYDDNKSFISRTAGGNFVNRVLEPPENARYFRFAIYESTSTSGKITEADSMANVTMIESGTNVTEYEPYKWQTLTISTVNPLPGIPVTSGGNYTDANGQQWICDEIDFARGVYVQRVHLKTLNGSEDWRVAEQNAGGKLFYCYDNDAGNIIERNGLSSIGYTPYDDIDAGGYGLTYAYHFRLRLENMNPNNNTTEELKAYLSANPIDVLVSRETPIETPLSETELAAYRALHTNKPNTTILNDSGAYMSVDYTADTKLYIDNLIKKL